MAQHVAVYKRVSTNRQDTRSQEADLQRWLAAQGEKVVVYEDKATGTNMDRPGWKAIEEAMRFGEVSTLVVWRIDRLGRTAAGLTQLFEELQQHGVNLVSLKDGLDLSNPAGRLMANVLASMAQFETELRAERVLAGQQAAKAKGKTWGGSKKGTGRKMTRTQIKYAKSRHGDGESIRSLARHYKVSPKTMSRMLNT